MDAPPPWPPATTNDETMVHVGRLLRRHHDGQPVVPDRSTNTVVCHNDVRPETVLLRGGRAVELRPSPWAAPGPRGWDVAGAVWRWVPLVCDWDAAQLGFDPDRERRGRRLRAFCDAYGLDATERKGLLDTVELRLEVADAIRQDETFAAIPGWRELRDERGGEGILRDRWFVEEFRDDFAAHLADGT